MGNIKARESIKIAGTITIETYRAGYAAAVEPLLQERRSLLHLSNTPAWRDYFQSIDQRITDLKEQFFIRTALKCANTVMDSPNYGLDLIIQQLVGIDTYPLSLDYIEIGTGQTTPTIADTALTAPTIRAAVTFQQDYATTDAIVQTIFSDSQLTNGTYYEMGTFAGGTSTIGSGQIFNHALFATAYTKISGQDTTVQVDFSFT